MMQETLLIIHRCIERLDFPKAAEVIHSSLVLFVEIKNLTVCIGVRSGHVYVILGGTLLAADSV